MGIRKAGEEVEEQQQGMAAAAASPEAGEQQPEEEDYDAAEQQQHATEDLFLMIGDLAVFYESELKESPASLGVDAAATAVFETGKQIAAAATQCLAGDPSQQTPLLYAFLSSLEKLTTRTLASIRADVSALAASPEETPARSSYINHKLKLLAMAFALQPPLAGQVECDLGPEIAAAMAEVLVQAVQFPVGPVLAELLPLCAHMVAIVAGALSQESGGAFSSAVMAAFNGQAPTLSSYAAGLIIMPYLEVPIDEGIQVFRAAFEQPAPLSAAMAAFAFMHLFIEASDRTVAPLPVVEELLPAAIACIFAQYFEEDFAPFAKKAFAWLCQFWNDGNSSELLESIAEHLFKVIQESVSRKYPPSTFIHEVSNLATLLASNVFLGQQFHQFNGLMESFSRSFRPKLVMQTVFATASEFALHPDWQIRCACYDSIVICGETFLPIAKQFLPRLPAILEKCSKDPHPRVRYCASSIVGQLSLDFEETLTKAYAPVCLNLLVELLKDPDVTARSQAALALINWCEVAHRKETDPFLPALIPLILGLLQSGEAPCEIAGLKAVFSLANFMLADFQQYYAAVDTHLKALWNSRTEPHQQGVRSECLTTISLVGMNAGKERFGADALALCKFLEATKIAKDDPLYKQVPLIYCRLSYVLQEDFVAFLPAALASIFAELEDETSCCKVVHDYNGGQADDQTFVLGSGAKFKPDLVRISLLNSHLLGLVGLMDSIPHLLRDHYMRFLSIGHRMMTTTFNEQIIETGLTAVEAVCRNMSLEELNEVMDEVVNCHLDAFAVGFENLVTKLMDNINTCMDNFDSTVLHDDTYHAMVDVLVVKELERCKSVLGSMSPEDAEEDCPLDLEMATDILRSIANLSGTLLKSAPARFLPCFLDSVFPTAVDLANGKGTKDIVAGLCLLHDFLEHCPEEADKHFKVVFPPFFKHAASSDPEMRQAACSGLGFAGLLPSFQNNISNVAVLLKKVITTPGALKKKNAQPTENAIAAFGRILVRWHPSIPPNIISQFANFFLSVLPVKTDTVEAPFTYRSLCTLLSFIPAIIFGPNNENLSRILQIFAFLLDNPSLVPIDLLPCFVAALRTPPVSPDTLLQAIAALPPALDKQKISHGLGLDLPIA